MMEITKKDLRKTSKAFRSISNRVINAHYDEFDSILKMFLDHIESTPLIFDYINSLNVDFNEQEFINHIHKALTSYGSEIFNTGQTIEEETFITYKLLKYLSSNNMSVMRYGQIYGGRKLQEMTRNFATRVILPFVNHIVDYLTDISIDMGFDEEAKFMINVNGGQAQVNISRENSSITANQTNNIQGAELEGIISSIKSLITNEIPAAEREVIIDNLDVIEEQLKTNSPKKGFLKTAWNGLNDTVQKIPNAVQLVETVNKLSTFVAPYLV